MRKLRDRRRSPRQTIEVQDDIIGGRRIRRLLLDSAEHSAIDLDDPARPVWVYTDFIHLAWIFKKDPERILIAGLGGGVMPLRLRRTAPKATVDVVEYDPEVVSVARRWFGIKEDARLSVHVDDARRFLEGSDGRFDLFVLDVFKKEGQDLRTPPPFLSEGFFRTALARLSKDGALVFNLIGRLQGRAAATLSVIRRLERVFPQVYLFPIFLKKAPDLSEERNIMVVCSMGKKRLGPEAVLRRAKRLAARDGAEFYRVPEYAENYYVLRPQRLRQKAG